MFLAGQGKFGIDIDEMIEDEEEFDFMQGAHDYKLKFKTGSRDMMDAFMCQRSFTGRLNYGLAKLSSFFRRLRG